MNYLRHSYLQLLFSSLTLSSSSSSSSPSSSSFLNRATTTTKIKTTTIPQPFILKQKGKQQPRIYNRRYYRLYYLVFYFVSLIIHPAQSFVLQQQHCQRQYQYQHQQIVKCSNNEIMSDDNNNNNKRQKTIPIITFVTGNKKKLQEVKQILGVADDANDANANANDNKSSSTPSSSLFELTNIKLDLPELQGDPIDIAKEKCKIAVQEISKLYNNNDNDAAATAAIPSGVFIEDTSLCFNALNGLPGPYIKWFLDKCGHEGLNQMLDGFTDRTAYAQTIVAYCSLKQKNDNNNDNKDGSSSLLPENDDIHVFDGRTHGKIVRPRGSLDFGWDPIFEPNQNEQQEQDEEKGDGLKTYAEMTKEEKNAISHRGRSFAKFRKFLEEVEFGTSGEKEQDEKIKESGDGVIDDTMKED